MNILKYVKLKDGNIIKICPECSSSTFIYDYRRQEIICSECSLIVSNHDLMTLEEMEVYKLFDNENDNERGNDG